MTMPTEEAGGKFAELATFLDLVVVEINRLKVDMANMQTNYEKKNLEMKLEYEAVLRGHKETGYSDNLDMLIAKKEFDALPEYDGELRNTMTGNSRSVRSLNSKKGLRSCWVGSRSSPRCRRW